MQYFIGIVPPDDYKDKIINFQKQWDSNDIMDVVEPHITLKAQGGLTEDEEWIAKVKTICKSYPSIHLSIHEPKFFGDDILYLSASSNELFSLHEKIVQAISPSDELINQYFELENFVPHMTLAKTHYGLSKQELRRMAKRAENELTPYPSFEVSFVRVYQEKENNEYVKYMDIPLLK
ncbi:2'-5' RNA ligase family protein [Salinibacillus xinjiangensis]|uniref:2'-5' RNA ligase family protein n=1 Tax=Salinibacillus xinjiangensis TaxID=1229268 RepID=A0A6G1X4U0_9BACI|nr:2'-5' RNA ligase family protein [Salinibacillus xinjiangensis]MRG85916.1 2'-5' RNA ligase family protein [Salinibacillus xinjiangensis]